MNRLAFRRVPRLRTSPYFDATIRHGATEFTIYNHMLLPAAFSGGEAEYKALVEAVTIWDVAAQRQVEIRGPDAERLTQLLVTRDVTKMGPGQARYGFVCNHSGGVLNDPVILRLADDRFWLSLADRDILLWAQGIAGAGDFDVTVCEPDVSPLQVQGPRSADLIGDVFGAEIRDLGYYRFTETELAGVPLVISRTGWSGEFGYEVFLRDGSKGDWLWERLFAAGEPYGVEPAAPNQIRRIEAGILSYGTDMDDTVTPLELGFRRLVDLDGDGFIGQPALREQAERGLARMLTGLRLDGPPVVGTAERRPLRANGVQVGQLSSMAFSPRLEANVGLGIVAVAASAPGTELVAELAEGERRATTEALPFVVSIRDP